MSESTSPPPDIDAYLADPNRRALELDFEARKGPVVFRWLTGIMEHLIAAILVALIISVSANVIGRSLLNNSLPWADELARMLFVWLVFIGAAAVFAHFEHIAVDFVVRKLKPRAAYTLYLVQHLIISGLMGIMIWGGYVVMSRSTGRTAILGVPWNLINVSLVLCSIFILSVALWRAWQCVRLIRMPPSSSRPHSGVR
ncbi:TRAP transporter small permease [Halomonas sp.]|uniref:TRAP transporter small permease n=1 Tax=Halomonas sp. TaxID=1486246 RepID=UPI0035681979